MTKKIALSRGMFAIVSEQDYDNLNKFKWHVINTGYANRVEYIDGKRKHVTMHRQLLNFPDGMQVDHINGNRLDNRRENLRICSQSENTKNKKPRNGKEFKGVLLQKNGRWRGMITHNGKRIHLGMFSTKIDAAKAYNKAALKLHGDFASLNSICS